MASKFKNNCSAEQEKESRLFVENNWEEIGQTGSDMRNPDGSGDWAGVLKKFPQFLDFLNPKAAKNKITLLTEKVEAGDFKYKMNGMTGPDHGWEIDKQLFEWCCVQLQNGIALNRESVRQQLNLLDNSRTIDRGGAWNIAYKRLLSRNNLCEDPAKFHTLDLASAKCIEGCLALELKTMAQKHPTKTVKCEIIDERDSKTLTGKIQSLSINGLQHKVRKLKHIKTEVLQ